MATPPSSPPSPSKSKIGIVIGLVVFILILTSAVVLGLGAKLRTQVAQPLTSSSVPSDTPSALASCQCKCYATNPSISPLTKSGLFGISSAYAQDYTPLEPSHPLTPLPWPDMFDSPGISPLVTSPPLDAVLGALCPSLPWIDGCASYGTTGYNVDCSAPSSNGVYEGATCGGYDYYGNDRSGTYTRTLMYQSPSSEPSMEVTPDNSIVSTTPETSMTPDQYQTPYATPEYTYMPTSDSYYYETPYPTATPETYGTAAPTPYGVYTPYPS